MQISRILAGAAALAALAFTACSQASAQVVYYNNYGHPYYHHVYHHVYVPNNEVIVTHHYYHTYTRSRYGSSTWVPGHSVWRNGERVWIPGHRV